ncbi:MAG: GNAT family N-acetyltransferase [Opitutaceae bacterium]|nr:GNAT family N-acetyltransferase [Cytophagales bacterium]
MPRVDFYISDRIHSTPLIFFFNSPDFQSLFEDEKTYSFFLKDVSKTILARIHFKIEEKVAFSFKNAPFGFLETGIDSIPILNDFLNQIEIYLKQLNIITLKLRAWPQCYNAGKTQLISQILLDRGYEILYSDFNFFLMISGKLPSEIFKKPERKRLRKCNNAGFKFLKIENPDSGLVYEHLLKFRNQKHIPLNISKSDLQKAFSKFPGQYFAFQVCDKEKVVSISVCVEVTQDILYHFMMATDVEYNNFSPGVLLYDGIYKFCQEKNYKIFDFGTASIEGNKQVGLFNFKEKLGSEICLKTVFSKQLL